MFKYFKKTNTREKNLYNKILSLSRNKLFYTKFDLLDTFQNRINLIFLHISFIFIRIKLKEKELSYKKFYQKMFDFIFKRIELDMREIGYGDMVVNKNMKFLVKSFYNILLNCENYQYKNLSNKNHFLLRYLRLNSNIKTTKNIGLVEYFDKYQIFCLDLGSDKVLKGELNFEYK